MQKIYINPNWTFKDIIERAQKIKKMYKYILSSFSQHDIKLRNDFLYDLKRKIYELKFEEWKRDKIWSYLNDYDVLLIIQEGGNRQNKLVVL